MTKPTETPITPTVPRKPDGTITMRTNKQIYIIDLFFNHDSKETFEDKLLRVILAEKTA